MHHVPEEDVLHERLVAGRTASAAEPAGAAPDLIAALRAAAPLDDERLEALRAFTIRVLDTAGDVGDDALEEFLSRGFTTRAALDVVLGIGTYTMSTLANRLTGAPVDAQLSAFA